MIFFFQKKKTSNQNTRRSLDRQEILMLHYFALKNKRSFHNKWDSQEK